MAYPPSTRPASRNVRSGWDLNNSSVIRGWWVPSSSVAPQLKIVSGRYFHEQGVIELMMDVIVRGGDVIDGTGAPRRRADVGVRRGRVEVIGDLESTDAPVAIDATGRVVTPGFVDVHTHLDAQGFWDTTLSPSPLHGVTTVIAGNCGFSLSPLSGRDADADYLMRMLSRVEGMPLESLREGVPWDWRTTGEYLDRVDRTLAINTAYKVGHSTLRRTVLGSDATRREATPDEVRAMCNLLRTGLQAGAIGFSSSWSSTHNDTEGNKVPSRYSSREELLALCEVLAHHPGTSLEFIPCVGPFDEAVMQLMTDMSVAADATLNWNVLAVDANNLERCYGKLAASDYAAARGGRVVALTAPMSLDFRLSFRHGFLLDAVPGWEAAMLLPHDQKRALLADPAARRRLGEMAAADHPIGRFTDWEPMVIFRTAAPENAELVGHTVGEIADERGVSAWDALCDIALADDLQTYFGPPTVSEPDATWEARRDIWRDPRVVVGASDAGAHLDMFLSANYPTTMLGEAVVKRRLLSLEEAIHYLTQVSAELYGLRDRGTLEVDARADLVVIDERAVASGRPHMRADLPGGAARLFADAAGIGDVLCNGAPIVKGGRFTDERPGRVLRAAASR